MALPGPFTLRFPKLPPFEKRGDHWWVELDGHEVRLSNLHKVFWAEEGFTKGDLLAYYYNVAPYVVPHLAGRPLTLKRMPYGTKGAHFYQKDAPDYTPPWLTRCAIEPEDGKVDEMLVVEKAADLLYVANLGAIEFHPLHARCERYDRPDYMVFDLDPAEPAGFTDAMRVALVVRTALERLGLNGYAKASGATGIQIFVPVEEKHTYDETRELAGTLGRMIVRVAPDLVTMEWAVERRAGKVFIDANMNRRAASFASAYSVRPLPGAPVSAPLTWEEIVEGRVRPHHFTMSSICRRLEIAGDLFEPVLRERQDLDPALTDLNIAKSRRDVSAGRLRRMLRGHA